MNRSRKRFRFLPGKGKSGNPSPESAVDSGEPDTTEEPIQGEICQASGDAETDPAQLPEPNVARHSQDGHDAGPDLPSSPGTTAGPAQAAPLGPAPPGHGVERADQVTIPNREQNQDDMDIQTAGRTQVASSSPATGEPGIEDSAPAGLATVGPEFTGRHRSRDPGAQGDLIPVAHPGTTVIDQDKLVTAARTAAIPIPLVMVGNPTLGSNPAGLPSVAMSAPDSVLDGAQYAGLTVRAASLRGDDHRFAAETRQDSFGIWALKPLPSLETDRSVLFACVADGVGSHELSHLGSARACWLARQSAEAHLANLVGPGCETAATKVIGEVAAGLRAMAADYRLSPKQVSTTLTACLVVPAPKGDLEGPVARAIVFNVGDSPCLVLREKVWTSIPSGRSDGESLVDTRTDALPQWANRCQTSTFDLFCDDMLLLCTDGLGKPMESNQNVKDQLAEWWNGSPPSLPEFYWQMSFRAQTFGDDRSAVCIWVNGGE